MNTSSRISEIALPAAAPARPKARCGWLLALLAVVALASSAWASGPPVSFRPPLAVSGPGTGGQIKLIDLNNDGKLDAVVGTLDSTFVTYLGNGNGTFAAPVSTTVTAVSGIKTTIAVGDINGDGKPDVVTATVENILRVFLGNGDGTFTASSTYPTGSNPSSIVIGDFNRDGFMDVAVGNFDSGTIRLFQGTATPAGGLFPVADQLDFNTPGAPVVIGAMDFNGDGFTDLAWSTSSGLGFLYDSRLPRPTGFLTHAFSQRGGVAAGVLTPGGLPTVAVTEDLAKRLKVFLAPPTSGTFQMLSTGVTPTGLVVADLNGDGQGDIIVANQDINAPTIGVYLGNGDNTVESAQYVTVGAAPVSVAAGDLDGDGQPDVVVADLSGGFKVLVQQHRTQLTITAPTFASNEPAIVTVAVSAVGFVPTGSVTLSVDGGAALSAALVNGQATFNLGILSSGSYSLAASYAAQNGFVASTGTGTLTIVAPRPTQITVSAPTVTVNQSATVTIAVASPGNPVPTGSVTLSVNGGEPLTAALVNGQGTFNLGSLPYGSHSLAASYAAQNGYLASTGSGTLTVNRLTSLLVLTQSPKVYRDQPPSLVANFGIGLGPGGTVPVQCYTDSSLTTPIPPPTNVGTYFATASFAGDATYAPTSLAQSFTIARAATRIDLSIAATFPNTGLPVAPTGVVTFVDDTFGIFGVFIDVGTASFPPTFTYYLASDTGFANPLAGPPRDSGSYVIVATLAATANYQAATPQSAAFSIVGAPSLVVTITVDEDNGTSDPANGTGTSLREALKYAQNLGGARTITFAPGLAGQTVTLTAGWSGSGDASALAVSTAVTIQGLATSPGVTLAIGAGVTRRHFSVAYGGALTLQNLTLTGGNAYDISGNGGSIESDGDLNVTGCTFTGNIATRGGALYLSGPFFTYLTPPQMRVANSTFTGNTTATEGGAIFTRRGVMALTNVTIADNNSQKNSDFLRGGGIYQQFNETRLVNCIIARNTPDDLLSEFSQVVDSYNNLIGVPAASLGLGALADNGGPTRTMALQPNSPALNAGATVAGLTTDQRGAPRDSSPDIGAFEFNGFGSSLVVTTAVDENNGTNDPAIGNGRSLREALLYAQSIGGAQTITFAPNLAGQTVTLTVGWSGSGDASALAVSTAVTIQGPATAPGVTLAIGAGVPRRHFYVSSTGSLTLQNFTLTGGNCPSGGGAIFSEGILDVTGCTFTGNHSAQEGGALWNYGTGTQTQVKNSTFAGNTSVLNGGAISTACELMTLTNVTIADNSITGTVGGGIHQFNGTTRLVNTIVARNTANGSPNNVVSILATLDAANSFNNLLGADVAGATGSGLTNGVNGNKVGMSVSSLLLGTLADNGGPTRTIALLAPSPAVNSGTNAANLSVDQRGVTRDSLPDIGAFEFTNFAPSLVVTTPADEDNGTSDPAFGTGTSLREALHYAQNLGGARTITFAPGLAGQTVTLTAGWGGSGDRSALSVSTAVTIQGFATSPGITLAMGAGLQRRHFSVAFGGALTLQNLTLTGGNVQGDGISIFGANGGSIESYGELDVTGCTFTGNAAVNGGALFLSGPPGSLTPPQTRVTNSTFAGNTSRLEGGAIFTSRGVMALSNVTIADNNSQSTSGILPGGGIFQQFNETRLVNCIIARNTPNDFVSDFSQVVDSSNNLIGVTAASLGLSALADNGGPTRTMALQPNSPALNAGATVANVTTDQRGQGRPQFGAPDIGAFELNAFDTGQATLSVGGAYWYLGPPAVGSDLRVYYLLPGQPEVWVDNGVGVRIGQAGNGTVLVENSSGEVYARTGSTTGIGTAWPRLTSVVAGDGATWFFGPDGLGSDAYIYRWASGGAPTYSFGFGTQLSVAPNGAIFARNNAGNDYLRVGSDAGLGSSWQIVNRSLVSWRLLHGLPYDGTQDLANPSSDGVANLLKYAFNLAPNIGDLAQVNLGVLPAHGTAGLPFITPDPQGRLFIEFVRRKATTLPGIACIVETGDDLTALQTLSLTGATVVPIDATWERVTVTDPTLTPNRFGRVRVQIVP